MKIRNIILTSLLGIFTTGCGEVNKVADSGYLDSGYTKEELEAKGVNTRHLFVFTEQRATYNGHTFSIHIPIDSLINTLGSYDRILYGEGGNAGYSHYFWDEIGFVASVSPEKDVMRFSLHWDYLPKVEEYDYDNPDPAHLPAKFFKGKILLNGVALDNTSDYEAYCNNKEVQSQIRKLARKEKIRNYRECFYHYVMPPSINRYESSYHDLYFFDYEAFGECPLNRPFFSYEVKIAIETGQMHEFGMQYDVYTNPDFKNPLDLFF